MTELGSATFTVRGVAVGFDKIIAQISQAEAALKKVAKVGLQDTAAGKNLFVDKISQIEELRHAVGQSAEDIERANKRITNSFNSVSGTTNTVSGAFKNLSERGGFLGKIAGGLGGLFGKAESALSGFGLSISNVSVLLGAGFAGGIAGVIQVGIKFIETLEKMAQAVVKFAFNAAILSSQTAQLKENISATFGAAGDEVIKFAEKATFAFGVSEGKALEFLNSFGQLLTQFGLAEESVSKLSTGLFSVASALRRGKEASVSAAESLQLLRDVLAGNIEGLRKLDVRLSEVGLKKLGEELGVKISGPLDDTQRALLAIIAATQIAKDRLERLPESATTLSEKFEVARNLLERITRLIGDELAPVFGFLADAAIGFAIGLLRMVQTFSDAKDAIAGFIERTPALQAALEVLKGTLVAMFPALSLLAKLLGVSADSGKAARESARIFEDELGILDGVLGEAKNSLQDYAKGLELTQEEINSIIDAHKRLERAVRDAAEAESDARLNLSRVREDNAKRAEDARRNLARAIDDAVKAEADARRNLDKVKESTRRSVRDAEEKLADKQIDNAKKVDSAERDLAKARLARSDAVLKAQLSVAEAMLAGDALAFNRAQRELSEARRTDAIKEAQRKRDETVADSALEIARLQRDLDEKRADAKRDVEEAERKLQETIIDGLEKIEDANRRIGEVEVENNRNLFDARQRLNRVLVSNAEKIADAEIAEQRLLDKFGVTLDKVEHLNNALIVTKRRLEEAAAVDFGLLPKAEGGISVFGHGGSIFAGRGGIVGDRGPELFIPNQNGEIISNDVLHKLIAAMNRGQGGGEGSNSFNIFESVDADTTARAVALRLAQGIRQ